MKKCNICKINKTIENFNLYRKNKPNRRNLCKDCQLEQRRKYQYPYRKEKTKYYKIKDRYGLSKEEYDLLINQNPSCQSCGEIFINTPHVDHNHETNKIRGLLCGNCNKALGLLKDDPIKIVNLLRYLLEGSETISKESTPKRVEVPSP